MAVKSLKAGIDSLLGEAATERVRPKANVKTVAKTSEIGTKEGETRATFIVQTKQVERLKAIAFWDRAKIKDVHAAALEMYLNSRSDVPKLPTRADKRS